MRHPGAPQSILKLGDSRLEKPCAPVSDLALVQSLIESLWATLDRVGELYDFKRGRGLSAPQIGAPVRVFIAEYLGSRQTFINPEIIAVSNEVEPIREGCLSFFGFRGLVPRHTWIHLKAIDAEGSPSDIKSSDPEHASLLQHEYDHLDGVLYFERLPNGKEDLFAVDTAPTIP